MLKTALSHEDQNRLTTQYTERAVKFIEKNKDRPFFFYLAHTMVHVPLHVSDKFRGKSQQGLYGDAMHGGGLERRRSARGAEAREDLGDSLTERTGTGLREPGRVDGAK